MALTHQLTKATVTVRHINAVAAGTSNQLATAGIDTQGYDAYRFVALLGTLTATQVTSLSAYECDTLAGSYTLVAGATTAAAADGDSNKMLILDVFKPQKRFIKAQVNRATANAVIDGVVCELWLASFQPTTQDASVSKSLVLDNPV